MSDTLGVGAGIIPCGRDDSYHTAYRLRPGVLWDVSTPNQFREVEDYSYSNMLWTPQAYLKNWTRLRVPYEIEVFEAPASRPTVRTRAVLDFQLPEPLWPVADAVDESRWMLDLAEDWDGEGSPAYTQQTWEKSAQFLLKNALDLWEECRIAIDAPAVHNGPEGSIDIYWKTPQGTLLINVPPDPNDSATFYGSSIRGPEIKGSLSLDAGNHWLLMWQKGTW